MVEYMKVTGNNIEVIGESEKRTITLGKLNMGEEYRLIHKGIQLRKIDYESKEGFISPNFGQIFWVVPE